MIWGYPRAIDLSTTIKQTANLHPTNVSLASQFSCASARGSYLNY